MPSKNVKKIDKPESYYHVYARGASKQSIFLETADYQYFINLFARYLSDKPQQSKEGVTYPHYKGQVELLCFCLMPNHFHILLYQKEQTAMSKFMQSIMTSYGRYFNLKYKRSGSLYESTYKAVLIDADSYLLHISRYIHLNPRYWLRYMYSSLGYYIDGKRSEWLQPDKIQALFNNQQDYRDFLQDYEEQRDILNELKHQLADQ